MNYRLDDELVRIAAQLPRVDRSDVAAARAAAARRAAAEADAPCDGIAVEDRLVPTADGAEIRLRVYRPEARANRGAIYHVHGGGFITGDLTMSHALNLEFARETGAVVVAVEYRLAPEWPYPTPVEDVYTGLVWLHEHAAELEVDPGRLVVHGQSAGGALGTGAVLMARDRNGPPIRFLLLTSPTVDDRATTRSSRIFTDTPVLTRRDVELTWAAYLGEIRRASADVPAYAAPARARDLSGLPPTYISAAEADPLRDEAIAFAHALLNAGVSVELHVFPETFHGSLAFRDAEVSRRQVGEEIAVLRRALGQRLRSSR
ncbi:Acetyl esterase/lipase [Pseudonocardia thermophila]|uniref:Acetyl esterase/lipase n=1 Tax=Pseudonocardia thermophila TaxID=1848 RepID=A0A1M7BA99_PSETH|nr:alpha/beta hydrolase [Pseudonocardia thermophila]SHL51796.1 Acetyl esterase/lipase [Pseudonocardia thermophila]